MVYVNRTSMPTDSGNSEYTYLTPKKLHHTVNKNTSQKNKFKRKSYLGNEEPGFTIKNTLSEGKHSLKGSSS